MIILGIETSCDETSCSVVKDGVEVLSNVIASSSALHEKTGGVVPEIAARKQVEYIVPVIDEAFKKSGCKKEDISAIAVTVGPGLIGSLIVGVEAAKALSVGWDKPLIPVNHLVGHIYANFLGTRELGGLSPSAKAHNNNPQLPAIALIVSGGHTDLVLMRGHGNLVHLGGTLDDAAGEAFDKTARLLGISDYLGGALLSKKAAECKNNTLVGRLPRPMLDKPNYDFSFSGLKTAVKYLVEKENPPTDEVACEFETAAVDVLCAKTIKAAKEFKVKSILLGGGVAANTQLRARLKIEADAISIPVFIPAINYCGDSAVYIASAAFFNNNPKPLSETNPNPSLGIAELA